GATERLCLFEIGVASQRDVLSVPEFLHQLLLFGDVYRVPYAPYDFPIFKQGLAYVAHDAKSAFGMNNPICDFKTRAFTDHFFPSCSYHLTIVRMHYGKRFSERGNPLGGIKTQQNERFRRPVIERDVRSQRPASHRGKLLSLAKKKLTSRQRLPSLC